MKAVGRDRVLGYRQAQLIRFVRIVLQRDGISPSYGMIKAELGMEKANINKSVKALERRGYLSRVGAGRVRRIRLIMDNL